MKKVFLLLLSVLLAVPSYANCGNDDDHGNGCSGTVGPQGPKGDKGDTGTQGPTGKNGTNGADGQAGVNGKDGQNGSDATIDGHTFINLGASVRWYDWKNLSLVSGYRYDFNHDGHTVDALLFQFKLGKSYEQRKIADLEKKIEALMRILESK